VFTSLSNGFDAALRNTTGPTKTNAGLAQWCKKARWCLPLALLRSQANE